MDILAVENLSISFKTFDGIYQAIEKINFSLKKGEILGIVGETGCGKSVTARAIMNLLPENNTLISSGNIYYKNSDLLKLKNKVKKDFICKEMSMIFQDPMTYLNPVISVGKQLYDVVKVKNKTLSKHDIKKNVERLINLVKLPNPKNILQSFPHELSGGMRQRILIAMALAGKPKILIADEPTTALDVTIQAQILNLIEELRNELKLSVILITHDLGVLAQFVDRVIVMYAGQIVEKALTYDLFNNPMHPYTNGLLNAIPNIYKNNKLQTINGSLPDLIKPPAGCRFYDRCGFKMNKCKNDLKDLMLSNEHFVRCFKFENIS